MTCALFHGVWLGLLTLLLVMRWIDLDVFPTGAAEGVINYCTTINYPKARDYAWYFALFPAAYVGVQTMTAIRTRLVRVGWRGASRVFPSFVGLICALGSLLLASSRKGHGSGGTFLLMGLGLGMPLLDAGYLEQRGELSRAEGPRRAARRLLPMLLGCFAVSLAWIYDPWIFRREVDAHEAFELLDVQSMARGGRPGLDFKVLFGPLYTASLTWWMQTCGMTVGSLRVYFAVAQVLGTMAHLMVVMSLVSSWYSRLLSSWLMLTLSTASVVQYGWSNPLRTGLPLLAVAIVAPRGSGLSRFRLGVGALVGAAGLLYSPEYGLLGIFSCLALLVLGAGGGPLGDLLKPANRVDALHKSLWFVLSGVLLISLFAVPIYGSAFLKVFRSSTGGTIVARLVGQHARPLPAFPWWGELGDLSQHLDVLLWEFSIWSPGIVTSAALAWLALSWAGINAAEKTLLLALIPFAVLSQLPVIARPLNQVATSVPPFIVLLSLLLERARLTDLPSKIRAGLVAVALSLYGWIAPFGGVHSVIEKWRYAPPARDGCTAAFPRLGRVDPGGEQCGILEAVRTVFSRYSRPGEPAYVAAPYHAYACFLLEHPGLEPFPSGWLAGTFSERLAMVEALERVKPSIALVGLYGLDVPFAVEHPEEWRYIEGHYRLLKQIKELLVFVRRQGQ